MSQFSIHRNSNQVSRKNYPYLINVQSSLLDDLETRLVIPIVPKKSFAKGQIKELNPLIEIRGETYVVLTQQMAAIRKGELGSIVAEPRDHRQQILSAIDFLITGF